jgi:hypothetical protein
MVDNFYAGRTGNLIAEIDLASGRCGAALLGIGFAHKQVDRHPITGEMIDNFEIPDWSDACATVLQATALLPGLPVQAWDVAFTSDGPSLIEVNARGEFRILQHATQRGLIDEQFRRAVKL